ncbi:CheR family methyltransferase [Pseudooceanicola onchidii]|uniref:CheR family methyltransferase n=1 Tax=Pseudooceanicola onchidii TaxID=2562279 RepID=UPI0010AA0FAA|nr:protein-glutamate O-methyltransferase CheR [Pseudooceanicola onchidii]
MTAAATTGGGTLTEAAFGKISALAKAEAGLVLPTTKLTMVQSRLRHRMSALGLPTYNDYVEFVTSQKGAEERRHMISALTTNVSHFFRENHHFEIFRDRALPLLMAKSRAGHPVRIWSAGCSSGQEPYSIAMTIQEAAPELAARDVLILASDIDPNILDKAEAGIYSEQQINGIPPEMRKKYLRPSGNGLQIDTGLKRMIRFRELNLLRDWPMRNKFDAIFCRNVVIYFDAPTQDTLWPRFENALAPEGWFFLGHSERVSDAAATRFTSVGMTAYRTKPGAEAPTTKVKEA